MWKRSLSSFYFILILRFINCCNCNVSTSHFNEIFQKIQLELAEYSTTEVVVDNNTIDTATPFDSSPSPVNETRKEFNDTHLEFNVSDLNDSISEFYESSTEVNGTIIEENEFINDGNESTVTGVSDMTTEEIVIKTTKIHSDISDRDLEKKCRRFKNGTVFDIGKMADVWQIAYYRLQNQLKCFKLHIKMVKSKEQQRLAKGYGSFNNTVHWDRCNLEIKSSEKTVGQARRHFLQGTQNEKGVMDNIIIKEESSQNTTYLTLHRESADQWLVINNILVMRDCDTGDLVVFTRVPMESRRDDILNALMIFGENKANGTMACQEKADRTWLKYDENIISQPLL